jgi:probable O-glycosylation ligase (exosortase A-associated)
MIGLAMAMNVPLLHFLIKNDSRAWLRRIMWLMLVFSYPAIIFTFSRGAWLGLATVTALIVARSRFRFPLIVGSAIFAFIMLPVLVDFAPQRLVDRYETLENYEEDGSAQSRFGSWAYCRRVGFSNPLTGGGFNHQTPATYQKYAPEFHARWGDYGLHPACHNMWLTVLSDHGVVGLIVWLTLFGSLMQSLWRIRTLTIGQPNVSWMFNLAGALQIALAGFAVVGTFIDAPYFDMFYYFVAIVVIMKELMQKATVESPIATPISVESRARARLQSALSR